MADLTETYRASLGSRLTLRVMKNAKTFGGKAIKPIVNAIHKNRHQFSSPISMSSEFNSNVENEKSNEELRNKVRELEAEIKILRRSVPMCKDLAGKDVTEEIIKLTSKLAVSDQLRDHWENLYADQEQKFSNFKHKTNEKFRQLEEKNEDMKQRAKILEQENYNLKSQMEDDQSKLHRLQQDKEEDNTFGDAMDDFPQEGGDQRVGLIPTASTHPNTSTNLTGTYTDAEYVISCMLVLLEQLNRNGEETQKLQKEIVKFLNERGIVADSSNVEILSDTFRESYIKNAKKIRQNNIEYANTMMLGNDNSQMQRCLATLTANSSCFQTSFLKNASILGTSTNMELMNRSMNVTQDLNAVTQRMSALRTVCFKLFEKLQGTGKFLSTILSKFDESEEGQEFMQMISDIRLELDRSMLETKVVAEEFNRAEKSVAEFCEFVEQNFDQTAPSEYETQHLKEMNLAGDNQEHNEALAQKHREEIAELKQESEAVAQQYRGEIEELKHTIEGLRGEMINCQERITRLLDAQQSSKEEISQLAHFSEDLQHNLARVQKEADQLREEKDEAEEKILKLHDELETLNQELFKGQEDIIHYQEDKQHNEEKISLLEQESENLQGKISLLEQESESLQGKISQLEQESESLQGKISLLEQESNNLQVFVAKLQQESNNLQEELARRQQEIAEFQEKNSELAMESSNKENTVKSLSADIRNELKGIYKTLDSVASTTSSISRRSNKRTN